MDILLFDQHSDGHHIEYAGKLLDQLEDDPRVSTVDFLLTQPHPEGNLSTGSRPEYMRQFNHNVYYLSDSFNFTNKRKIVKYLFEFAGSRDYDILHALHIDDLLFELATTPVPDRTFKMCGTINGAFFFMGDNRVLSWADEVATELSIHVNGKNIRRLMSALADYNKSLTSKLCPPGISLRGCLASDMIDNVFVHSDKAHSYINKVGNQSTSCTVVPDPLELWTEESNKKNLRNELGIPTEGPMFLFFGQTRYEKGPDILLDACSRYEGPPCTVVLAGPPVDVDDEDVALTTTASNIALHSTLEFVPEEDVKSYFHAADAVVLPYRRQFGEYRTSGVFQKACAAVRPLIVSDFGELALRTNRYDLGMVFPPEDPDALADILSIAASESVHGFEKDQMVAYARSQSYDNLAEETVDTYSSLYDLKTSSEISRSSH
ncbi:glycosyltransferase [Haloarcula sp. NS06]|uniref:glycosyltransferase n=1 Tax=Haloarcula sp. NS06 TaxID=3409688 RepID=UPI003DA6FD88